MFDCMSPAVAFGSFVLLFRLPLLKPLPLKAHQPLKAVACIWRWQLRAFGTGSCAPAKVPF